jgi:iron-sulfur cluster repair protein YtfE (RIC family)
MPRRRSRSDVQTRTDHGGDGRIAWPSAAGSQITKLQPVPLSPAKHLGGRTNLTTDLWRSTRLGALCSYLEHRDHIQLRNQLATMTGTVAAAVATYGDSDLNVLEINRVYYELRRNLWTHMFREEHGFYSSIRNVELHQVKAICASSILIGAIRVLRQEHRYFAKEFRRIAKLLRDYEIPLNAGQKYRDLVHGFRELEAFKLQHMKNENIVYSRALILEKQLMGRRPAGLRRKSNAVENGAGRETNWINRWFKPRIDGALLPNHL